MNRLKWSRTAKREWPSYLYVIELSGQSPGSPRGQMSRFP